MLEADNRDIFDMVLRLTAYHYPENIVLPQGKGIYFESAERFQLSFILYLNRVFPAKFGY